MGWSLKKMLTPPKSIRKFKLKKLGKLDWWKEMAQDAAFIPEHQRKMKFGDLGKGEWWKKTAMDVGKKAAIAGSIAYGPALLAAAPGAFSSAAGSIGSASGGLGGMMGMGGGGGAMSTIGNIGKIGMMGKGMYDAHKAGKQSKKDSKMARNLATQAMDMYRASAMGAQNRYNMNSPLRDAFRMSALNFSDPTNPFSRDFSSQFAPNLQQESYPADQQPSMFGGLFGQMGQGPGPGTQHTGGNDNGMSSGLAKALGIQGGGRSVSTPVNRKSNTRSPGTNRDRDRGRDSAMEMV
jgi:hypothetical protein